VPTLKEFEADLVHDARLHYSGDPTVRMFRNNVGALPTADGKVLRYGLCTGSSDIIGLKSVTITPDMVGSRVAIFIAAEGKIWKGKATREQSAFLRMVKELGGRAGVFRNIQGFTDIVEGRK
jgi:hypothetical protein